MLYFIFLVFHTLDFYCLNFILVNLISGNMFRKFMIMVGGGIIRCCYYKMPFYNVINKILSSVMTQVISIT